MYQGKKAKSHTVTMNAPIMGKSVNEEKVDKAINEFVMNNNVNVLDVTLVARDDGSVIINFIVED